jgi:hypothetical protein
MRGNWNEGKAVRPSSRLGFSMNGMKDAKPPVDGSIIHPIA